MNLMRTNSCLSGTQENKHGAEWRMKMIQHSKTEFNKREMLKRTYVEVTMELKTSTTQLENSREHLMSTMAQV